MTLPFNITNPGIYISGLLTSAEAAFVTNLTNQTYSTGDILYFNGTNFVRLPIGSDGQVLTVVSGVPDWDVGWGGGSGDVVGPASATDNAIARFDGTTGKLIQNSGVTLNDSDSLSGVVELTTSGNIEIDGPGNAFFIADRNATSNFAALQFQTNNVTQATVGMYNNTSTDLVIQKDNADAGRRSMVVFKANDATVFNEEGGDHNLRVEGDTDQNLLFIDAGTDRVGIGTATPAQKLDVVGNGAFSGDVTVADEAYDATAWNGSLEVPTKNAIRDKIESMAAAGGITRSITVTSGNLTVGSSAATDYVVLVAGAHTVTLPTAVGNTNLYTIKNNHTANITVNTTSSQTIDGTTTISLAPEESVQIISTNSAWSIV